MVNPSSQNGLIRLTQLAAIAHQMREALRYLRPEKFDDAEHEQAFNAMIARADVALSGGQETDVDWFEQALADMDGCCLDDDDDRKRVARHLADRLEGGTE
jgi:hypothetical protein